MKRWWVVFLICAFPTILLARPGVVHTRDGLVYDGDVTETENTVTVRVRNIATTVARGNVLTISYDENLAADIESRWKNLKPDDLRGRMALGKEAFEARQYLLARKILQEVLDIDPNNRAASDLYDLSRAQIDLEHKHAANGEAAAPVAATAPSAHIPALFTNERRFVSLADINNIREMEISPRDANIRLRVDPDVIKRFTIGTDIHPDEFRSRPPLEQFLAIRESGRPDLLRGVHVLSDPQTIIEFRRDVQPPILAGCAAANCHGAPAHAGNFQLLGDNTDPAVYTNYFNLSAYTKNLPAAPGVFGNGAEHKLIDRAMPENSLLLQYLLPPELAAIPHPQIKNVAYRGVVRGKDDARYQRIGNWIANVLSPTESQYTVLYKPPFLIEPPATEPAPVSAPIPAAGQ